MLLGILFILGMINFAVHKAVLESNHPLLDTLPAAVRARLAGCGLGVCDLQPA